MILYEGDVFFQSLNISSNLDWKIHVRPAAKYSKNSKYLLHHISLVSGNENGSVMVVQIYCKESGLKLFGSAEDPTATIAPT